MLPLRLPRKAAILVAAPALILLFDAVVEAHNQSGELLGFERAAKISTQSAEKIAQAAQAHGQEDHVTALTLTRLPVTPEPAPEAQPTRIPAPA